ncbi:MAG: hypothetical protein ABSC55_00675 [Syntrophorhabdales bacterium]
MPRKVYLFFSLLLLAAGFCYLVTWPIAGTDTDMWYHLNGGRYLYQTGSVARTSFFSFLEPQRVWVNYYWLFQALVYQVFSWSGYMGLIFFRTLLSCATLLMIFFYLYKDQKDRDALLYYTLLFVFYVLLFLPRSLPVRPHLFSYLLIIIFLYVLEFKPRKVRWLLPPLAVVWSNLHGVEYPVMLLLLGAYFVELVYERMTTHGKRPNGEKYSYTKLHSNADRGGSEEPTQAYSEVRRGERRSDNEGMQMKATWYYPSILIFSAAAVLCTPHGIRLLAVPFKSITQVSRFVYELRPLSIYDFISFFGILFLLAGFVAITAVRKRKMRISHLLLFLGCIILLLEAKRFVNEYALLVLPLLRAYIPVIPAAPRAKVLKLVAAVLSVAFMAMPFFFMHWFFSYTPRYPVSARQLPEGVALFLKRVDGAGSVLNYPDTGGYLEWELYPRCKIFMDMQVPFLFTAEDFRTARSAFTDQGTLREVISRYRPVFITVPIEMDGFKALIAGHPQYRLLFFDDAEVLYVDGSQEPALALRYEIKTIDPFSLYSEPVRSSPDDRPSLKELLRLSDIYPTGGIVNAAITTIYQRQGRYREAMPYADAIISTYPESHLGYKLKADLLSRLGACAQAVPLFKKAIDRSEGAMRELIETEASACTRQLRDAR